MGFAAGALLSLEKMRMQRQWISASTQATAEFSCEILQIDPKRRLPIFHPLGYSWGGLSFADNNILDEKICQNNSFNPRVLGDCIYV